MASYYQLGSGLGDLFKSRMDADALKQGAYNAQTRTNMEDAKLQGDVAEQNQKTDALRAMPGSISRILGIDQGQGQDYTNVAEATGSKMSDIGSLFKTIAQQGYLKGAQDAMTKGNTLGMNFDLSAGGEKPLDMTRVEGNTAINPNLTPDQQPLPMTPYGKADITLRDRTTSKVIPLSDTASKVFAVIGTDPKAPDYGISHIDSDKLGKFTQWASDKKITDLNAALPQYLKQVEHVNSNLSQTLSQATAAVRGGKDPQAVFARLIHLQVDPVMASKATGIKLPAPPAATQVPAADEQ